VTEQAGGIEREIDRSIQRDKPHFSFKKRHSQTRHERLHDLTDDAFLKQAAEAVAQHWNGGPFSGLILLGQAPIGGALRKLLPKEVDAAVVEQAPHAMTSTSNDIDAEVAKVLERWRVEQRNRLLSELEERRKNKHLIADGPVDVLDALQQGRAREVVVGTRRDLGGARCPACGYRFGAPVGVCVYCDAPTRTTNAVQEILRMSLRHRVPVHLLERNVADPLAGHGGVSALLRAEANWAPDASTARATQGQ
jgi:peptide subunit release factor 1 (eRF1)